MNLLQEHNDEVNFWPAYSDLAIVMIFIFLLFILAQFVANSRLLASETLALKKQAEMYDSLERENRARQEALERRAEVEALLAGERRALQAALARQAEIERSLSQANATRQQALEREAAARVLLTRQILARQAVENRQATIRQLFNAERGIRSIREDGNIQLFIFSADVLFPRDQANLSPRGEELLRNFAGVLKDHAEFYTRIEVEGHADENPSQNIFRPGDGPTDHGNWRLSAERAITVVQLFHQLGIEGKRLAVLGRSFYEPENIGRFADRLRQEQVWLENRRVQVRLFYSEVTL